LFSCGVQAQESFLLGIAPYKLKGYRKLLPKELNAMDPFAAETRQSLK
jgi:hypothetical protein